MNLLERFPEIAARIPKADAKTGKSFADLCEECRPSVALVQVVGRM